MPNKKIEYVSDAMHKFWSHNDHLLINKNMPFVLHQNQQDAKR